MTAWAFRSMGCGVGLSALLASSALADEPAALKWTPWLEFGGFYGSSDTSRGEAVLWVPFAQGNTSLLFGEARGKLFEDDMREGNFALGYRQMMANGWNIGLWGGYDIRESQYGNTFHQITGGIEALSDRWDVRANAYLPVDDSENLFTASSLVTSGPEVLVLGNQIGIVTTTTLTTTRLDELALWGFDAEVGTKLFASPEDALGPRHELRLYAGAYHFDHSDLPNSVTGPRVRAEWRMDDILDAWDGSRLTFEAEYSHDDLRDDRVEVGARLRLPFGGTATAASAPRLTAQERRMSEGLERDTDIVTDTAVSQSSKTVSETREDVEDAETGVLFDRVATVGGNGNLTATSSTAGANSLIIANGTHQGAHTLEGDQTLMGGGATIHVRGVDTGTVLAFTAAGPAAILSNPGNARNLTLVGNNTHVAGLEIAGSGDAQNIGVLVDFGVSNARIADARVHDTGNDGIGFGTGSSGIVSGGVIERAGSDGIYIHDFSTVSITGTTIADAVDRGINIFTQNTVTIADTTIADAGGAGIFINVTNNTVTLTDSALAGTFGSDGIGIFGGNTLSGTGNTAAGATFAPGSGVCNASGGFNGSFEVDGTIYFDGPGGNCP